MKAAIMGGFPEVEPIIPAKPARRQGEPMAADRPDLLRGRIIDIVSAKGSEPTMTMTVELGNLESVVQEFVSRGRYGSKSEVLREGVRLVQERESRLEELQARLATAIAQADAGEVSSATDVRARIDAKYGRHRD